MLDKVKKHSPSRVLNKAEMIGALCTILVRWQDEIEQALDHNGNPMSFDHVVANVVLGKYTAFHYDNGLLLMEVQQYPNFNCFHCVIAVGDMKVVTDAEEDLIRYAHDIGCTKLSANGRVGWPRIAKEFGWKHQSSVIVKDI